MAGFTPHPSHHPPSLQIAILGHLSKKETDVFSQCSYGRQMPMGWIFHSSPELPDPLMSSDFYINTKEISKRAGVFQQYDTIHWHGSGSAAVIFLSNQMFFHKCRVISYKNVPLLLGKCEVWQIGRFCVCSLSFLR